MTEFPGLLRLIVRKFTSATSLRIARNCHLLEPPDEDDFLTLRGVLRSLQHATTVRGSLTDFPGMRSIICSASKRNEDNARSTEFSASLLGSQFP